MSHPTIERPARLVIGTIVLAIAASTAPCHANPATERYVPIGKSPGMSGKYTHTGRIMKVDERSHTLTIRTDSRDRYEVHLLPQSQIWLDRSKARRSSREGGFEDCRKGRRVEIKYVDGGRDTMAVDWIKIESR
ncbi:MAG: hypothetical protein OES38_11570 [Gammaproteobacteria bacterium]|nr:hypothetical protein [Gammaproteobacteria bacterium]